MSENDAGTKIRIGYLLVAASVFMTFFDQWVMNVALEAMSRDFDNVSLTNLSWMINAYTITLGAAFILAGRFGDRYGHRAAFVPGVALFTVASLGLALSTTLPLLIAFRVVQAIGAALILPASLALLLRSVAPDLRHGAARIWASAGALAAVIGLILGGIVIDYNWRWMFLINVPVGLVVIWGALRTFPRESRTSTEPLPDPLGSVILTIGMALLIGSMVQGPDWGWADRRTLLMGGVAIALLAWFFRRCSVLPNPLIRMGMWRVRPFVIANIGTFFFSIGFGIMLLSNALWCQGVWNYSALRTGLAMAPGPVLVPFVAIASNRLVHRYGAGPLVVAGCLLFAISQLWRAVTADPNGSYVTDLLPSMLLSGVGNGLGFSTLMATGSTSLPAGEAGTGVAVINTGRQIASAIGVAIFVAILGGRTVTPAAADTFRLVWMVSTMVISVSVVSGVLLSRREPIPMGAVR